MPARRPSPSADPANAARVPPNQALTQKWPVLHYGSVPKVDLAAWRFRINGFTDGETVLTWQEFSALATIRLTADFHCVTGWSRLDNDWEGVPVREVVQLQRPLPSARFVMVYGMNGYSTNLPLNEFMVEDALFATHHDGAPLTPEHGGPLRLVVPRLYAWKSAKWVTGIEYMLKERPGFWERSGYHMHGDPWKEERYGGG